jgi:DNA-binding XRE family transcriptional regulator
MTIAELSKEVDVTEKTIYNIIKNRNTPKLSIAKTIANILNKTIESIFEFEKE